MTLKSIIITTAIAAVAVLGMTGSASAGKETWYLHKPHVNIGTIATNGKKAHVKGPNPIMKLRWLPDPAQNRASAGFGRGNNTAALATRAPRTHQKYSVIGFASILPETQ